MAIEASDSQLTEVETVKCESCNFSEDCTSEYIDKVRDRFGGRWICGLCSEAVKHELTRSSSSYSQFITIEEALDRHITFCQEFRSSTPSSLSHSDHPILAIVKLFLSRSLDSPARVRSESSSLLLPEVDKARCGSLARSESCFSSFSG